MRANSRIRINNGRLRQLTRASIRALEQTAEALYTEEVQAQVMPFDSGNLQNDSTFVDTEQSSNGIVSLVNATPYARRLYYHPEYEFQKDENPSAGAAWNEPWMSGGKKQKFVKNAFKELYRREAGI